MADNEKKETTHMYFGHFRLEPDTTFTIEDWIKILKVMQITFNPERFAELPKEVRRHFIVHDRKGHEYRYGRKPRSVK